jgi:O-acetyl-ADP-ribose deacetylase (regulator of RNase III)
MAELHYVVGDATEPVGDGPKIIAHICNDAGGWGRGFVLALSAKWPEPEEAYRYWYKLKQQGWGGHGFELGRVGFSRVSPSPNGICVANMIAQRGIRNPGSPRAVDYTALRKCLGHLGSCCSPNGGSGESVHMPRIGIGLGGGSWDAIEPIILEMLVGQGVETFVYDLPEAA